MKREPILYCVLICCVIALCWPRESSAVTAKNKYFIAEASYKKLRQNPKKQKYRDNWMSCIKRFQDVYRDDPDGPWAAAGMYMSGILYYELFKHSLRTSDVDEAIDIFKRIINRYPKSKYRIKAKDTIDRIFNSDRPESASKKDLCDEENGKKERSDDLTRLIETASPPEASAQNDRNLNESKAANITGLRFWSNPNYTRVVIDADEETSYTHRLLKKDPAIHKPQRLYVDLGNSKLAKDTEKIIPINDDLLSGARAGQYTLDSVRVVVDIKSFKTYKIFSLKNPFRIVIDVWGDAAESAVAKNSREGIANNGKISAGALAKQLALGVNTIVIDPGHGGRDYGAPGYLKGVHEKNVTLKIARQLRKKIREQLGCEVIMTRDADRYLTLEERTAIANTKNADLFISIHTNAARDRRAFGIETYFLNLATDDEAILVAARENATSTKNISDLQAILNDLMQNAKINESSRLATAVQESICKGIQKNYNNTKNKGVKQAPFYVLLGAQMPAILVETSFISNSRECQRLINENYQDRLCQGIVNGIGQYIRENNPTAFFKMHPASGSEG